MVPFGKTVTITPQTINVRTGDRTPGTPRTVERCAVWANTSTELVQSQETVTWDLTMVLPAGNRIDPTDTVTIDSVIYEVAGHPTPLDSFLTGWHPGTQVLLRTQTG